MSMPAVFDIFFYLFGAIAVLSALVTCFTRNIVYAAFSLLFTFFGVAGVYVLLSADFLAVAQLVIYVGGILVLLVFGVMLTNRITNITIHEGPSRRLPIAILCGGLLFIAVSLVLATNWISYKDAPWSQSPWNHDAVAQVTNQVQGSVREEVDKTGSQGTANELGKLMMTDYLLPFEVVSIVLLVALMGAALIARKEPVIDEAAHGELQEWEQDADWNAYPAAYAADVAREEGA